MVIPIRVQQILRTKTHHLKNKFIYRALADPDKILWINPSHVKYSLPIVGNSWNIPGRIKGGNWDKVKVRFDNKIVPRAIHTRFIEGKEWNETKLYQYFVDRLETHGEIHGFTNIENLNQYFERKDELYYSIKEHGVLSPDELDSQKTDHQTDFIRVNIAREGEFIFGPGGTHRLAIARILNIGQVPVKIRTRHKQWQKVRDECKRVYDGDGSYSRQSSEILQQHPDLYLISHPDLKDIAENQYEKPDFYKETTETNL